MLEVIEEIRTVIFDATEDIVDVIWKEALSIEHSLY